MNLWLPTVVLYVSAPLILFVSALALITTIIPARYEESFVYTVITASLVAIVTAILLNVWQTIYSPLGQGG